MPFVAAPWNKENQAVAVPWVGQPAAELPGRGHLTIILRAAFFVAVLSSSCWGQDFSRIEVFGGYSFFWVSEGKTEVKISGDTITASRGSGTFNGWNVSLGYNPTRRLGIIGEFLDVRGEMDYKIRIFDVSAVIAASSTFKSLLGGPQYSWRGKRLTISARALGGVAVIDQSANLTGQVMTVRGLSYAVALGGGMDFRLNSRLSWRVAQSDYVLTRFRERIGGEARQHSVRVSTGIVLHLFKR